MKAAEDLQRAAQQMLDFQSESEDRAEIPEHRGDYLGACRKFTQAARRALQA
jgi:hypothetical protein